MIDLLAGSLDGILGFVLQHIVYPIICYLEKKWNYVIPPDTTVDNIVREHTVLNVIAMAADFICAIIIFAGLNQRFTTYAGLMTIAMYILVDQGKIYCDQYKQLTSGLHVCFIKGKNLKNLKKYTPNLGRAIIAGIFIVVYLVLALLNIFQCDIYIVSNDIYFVAMKGMLIIMLWIKLKHCFMTTFLLKDCIIREKEEV